MASILVVDEDMMFADSIRVALDASGLRIAGTCASLEDAVGFASRACPDAALIALERVDGISAADVGRAILGASPTTTIVGIAASAGAGVDDDFFAGAGRTILSKDVSLDVFVEAVRAIAFGGRPDDGAVMPRQERRRSSTDRGKHEDLTSREREVLELLVDGASAPDIAEELGVSINTVRSHIQSLFSKLHVHSQLQAAAFALQSGLVDPMAQRTGGRVSVDVDGDSSTVEKRSA